MTIKERQFNEVKADFSHVMNEVVREGRPQLVQRRGDQGVMALVRKDDLQGWLNTFCFSFRVTLDEGEVAITADPVGVIGIGETVDSAMDDLVVELRAYAQRFFDRPNFYNQTGAAKHYPWLFRFALTDPDDQRSLLVADSEAAMPIGNQAVASAV